MHSQPQLQMQLNHQFDRYKNSIEFNTLRNAEFRYTLIANNADI